jgi:ketopantoate reductase
LNRGRRDRVNHDPPADQLQPKHTKFRSITPGDEQLPQAGSPNKPSVLRDIERGSVTEGDHILGDLTVRARDLGVATPILDLARTHVAAYEAGQKREAT